MHEYIMHGLTVVRCGAKLSVLFLVRRDVK